MSKRRMTIGGVLILASALVAGAALPGSPFVGCALGWFGCREGTNLCEYDCPGSMNCVRSGNPFEKCACDDFGFCETVECPWS
jgi:hypothetical protein